MQKFINYLDVDFGVTKIGNFQLERDNHTDALYWTNGCIFIWASPEFEGEEGIVDLQLQYFDENGNEHLSDGELFHLKNEGDLEAQKNQYVSVITAIIREVDTMQFYTHYYENMNSVLDYKFWNENVK
jgi:hypothetical protein